MLKKLIIYLIRKKLGLKRGECFQFVEQRDLRNWYYFSDDSVIKVFGSKPYGSVKSSVSLNWLLDDECMIIRQSERSDMNDDLRRL